MVEKQRLETRLVQVDVGQHETAFGRETRDLGNERSAAVRIDLHPPPLPVFFVEPELARARKRLQLLEQRSGIAVDSDLDEIPARNRSLEARWRPLRDHLPVIDDRDPVAQGVGLLHVVRGQDHGPPARVVLADELPQE